MSKKTSLQITFVLSIVIGITYVLLSVLLILLLILDPVKMVHDPGGLTVIFTAIFGFLSLFLFVSGTLTLGAAYSLWKLKKSSVLNFIISIIFSFPIFLLLLFLSSQNSAFIILSFIYFLYASISSLLLFYGREELTEE